MAGTMMGLGLLASGASGIVGAQGTSDANAANLRAAQQHNQLIQNYVNTLMQPAQNPYSSAINQFLGINVPQASYGGAGLPLAAIAGGPSGQPAGGMHGTPITNALGFTHSSGDLSAPNMASMSLMPSGNPGGPPPGVSAQGWVPLSQGGGMPTTNLAGMGLQDLGGGMFAPLPGGGQGGSGINPILLAPQGVDPSSWSPTGQQNLMTSLYGTSAWNPNAGVSLLGFSNGSPVFQAAGGGTQSGGGLSMPSANTRSATGGLFDMSPQTVGASGAPPTDQGGFLSGTPIMFPTPLGSTGGVRTPPPPNDINPSIPLNPPQASVGMQNNLPTAQTSLGGAGGGGGPGSISSFGNGQMYGYSPIQAAQFSPTMLGQAPLVGQQNPVGASQVSATPVSAAPFGTPGFNSGQDALLQMMRATPGSINDPTAALTLQQQASNPSMFQGSDAANALTQAANFNLGNQVDALHASAGNLGARFGTGMQNAEAQLRGSVTSNLNATLAPLYQQSFENAQNRGLTAAQSLQGFNQNLFGQQLGAAQSAAGNTITGAGQQLQASSLNSANALQAALANQSTGLNAGQFNAQLAQALGLSNQGVLAQYGIGNANIANQAGQFNATNLNQMGQFNAQQGNLYNQLILGGLGQASGLQSQSLSQNMGLLSLLAGLQMPQQQASPMPAAIGQLGSTIAMLPFINQLYSGGGGGGGLPTGSMSPYAGGGYFG